MTAAPGQPLPHVRPRPGVVKTLGVCNIVFSILGFLCISSSVFYTVAAARMNQVQVGFGAQPKVEIQVQTPTPTPTPSSTPSGPRIGSPMIAGFNPFMGMEDPAMVRFTIVENATSFLTNGLMFATGIGLINLRPWGARWWRSLAWVKIVLAFLFWGYFIVALVPTLSENLAKGVSAMFASQPGIRPGQAPPVAMLTRIYAITYLIVGLGAILFSSLYPVISLWLLSRPGVKAAIVSSLPPLEPQQP